MGVSSEDGPKSLRILAIDDEETVLKLYTNLLSQDGHKIITAASGQEAAQRVASDTFDLVFLDLKLPDIDGTELLKEIVDKIEWAPVIIVTANPSLESSIEAIRTGGVYEYIIKPFNRKDLNLAIRRAMEKAELTLQNRRLLKKLERTNQALTERVDELEKFAKTAVEYENKISDLKKKVKNLETKVKKS